MKKALLYTCVFLAIQSLVPFLIGTTLTIAGKDFDMQVYPGKEHSISGYATRKHLFTRMLRFFNENLKTGN